MEYLLIIYDNARSPTTDHQWQTFFSAARQSGVFAGGSEIGTGEVFGMNDIQPLASRLAGYMRFDTGPSGGEIGLKKIHQLLKLHPTVLQGGTVELCELPKS